jgi:hypothetical protein
MTDLFMLLVALNVMVKVIKIRSFNDNFRLFNSPVLRRGYKRHIVNHAAWVAAANRLNYATTILAGRKENI